MNRGGKLGFFAVITITALLFNITANAAPSFQDLNAGAESPYEDNVSDSAEAAVQSIPVVDAVALQRLLLLLDSIASSNIQAGYRVRRPESKNTPSSVMNSLYGGGPYVHNMARSSLDLYDAKKLDRSRKEDKRGSYTPCFFNPVSCFGK